MWAYVVIPEIITQTLLTLCLHDQVICIQSFQRQTCSQLSGNHLHYYHKQQGTQHRTSIILSSNKIKNAEILVTTYLGCPGKLSLNKCHRTIQHYCYLVSQLVFYGTFSTNRLYHATEVGNVSHRAGGEHKYHAIKQRKNTINQHNHKLSSTWALWR